MNPPQIVANLRVDVDQQGPDTYASVRQLTPAEARYIGLAAIPINPELTEGIVGHGKARCRKDDHYDEIIGLEIASARALADFASQAEVAAVGMVQTEQQFRAEDLARGLEEIGAIFKNALDEIGSRVRESA